MNEMIDSMKATLTMADGVKVDYTPAAVLMVEDEQYLVMRADQGQLVQDDVLLLRIEHGEDGTTLHIVEDKRPFEHAIEDSLGESKQIH